MGSISKSKEIYRNFSSCTMQRQLSIRINNVGDNREAFAETCYASVLIADISGFTRLSAKLSAEELEGHINEYFSLLITVIKENYGDVVKFLGDAVLVLWPINQDASFEVRAATALMASLCAIQLINDCGTYDRGEGKNEVSLRLHCGIGSGYVHGMCVGVAERWEYLVSGEPLTQVGKAVADANTGEICLSPTAFINVQDKLEAKITDSGNYKITGKAVTPASSLSNILHRLLGGSKETNNIGSPSHNKQNNDYNSPRRLSNSEKKMPKSSLSSSYDSPSNANDTRSDFENDIPLYTKTRLQLKRISDPSLNTSNNSVDNETIEVDKHHKKNRYSTNNIILTSKSESPHSQSTIKLDNYKKHSFLKLSMLSLSSSHNDLSSPTSSNNNSSTPNSSRPTISPSSSQYNQVTNSYDLDSINEVIAYLAPFRNPIITSCTHSRCDNTIPNKYYIECQYCSWKSHKSKLNPLIFKKDSAHSLSSTHSFVLSKSHSNENNESFITPPPLPTAAIDSISSLLPYFAHDAARVAIEGSTLSYLSELRKVVTLFIELLGLEVDFEKGEVKRPQKALTYILACMNRFGGSLRQYVVDDKGCVVIIAFGLPGSSHEDNCSRAVETAVAVRNTLKTMNVQCRQGIAKGDVYCGLVGSTDRCEYAMMGASVNLAARLMGKCAAGQILVNDTVHEVAQRQFTFQNLPPVTAKGYAEPVSVYSPVESKPQKSRLRSHSSADEERDEFFGRERELEELRDYFTRLSRHTSNSRNNNNNNSNSNSNNNNSNSAIAIMVQGDAGVGKTRLVVEALKLAEQQKVEIKSLIGSCTSSHSHSPYYFISLLIEQIIGLDSFSDLNTSRITIRQSTFCSQDTSTQDNSNSNMNINNQYLSKLKSKSFSLESNPNHIKNNRGTRNSFTFASSSPEASPNLMVDYNPFPLFRIDTPSSSRLSALNRGSPLGSPTSSGSVNSSTNVNASAIIANANRRYRAATTYSRRQSFNATSPAEKIRNKPSKSAKFPSPVSEHSDENTSSASHKASKSALPSLSLKIDNVPISSKLTNKLSSRVTRIFSNDEEDTQAYYTILNYLSSSANGHNTDDILYNPFSQQKVYFPRTDDVSEYENDSAASSLKFNNDNNSLVSFSEKNYDDFMNTLSSSKSSKYVIGSLKYENKEDLIAKANHNHNESMLEVLIPLLGPVLGYQFKESSVTLQMTKKQRQESTDYLLLKILSLAMTHTYNTIIIDSIQWIDYHSLNLLLQLVQSMKSGLFISTFRNQENNDSSLTNLDLTKKKELLSQLSDICHNVPLSPLESQDIESILMRFVGPNLLTAFPDMLSTKNINEINSRAGGSPLHAIILAQALRKALAEGSFHGIQELPAGAHNIVVARIDQLTNTEQVILKTASVFGLVFSAEDLQSTLTRLGYDHCAEDLIGKLNKLLDSHLILSDTPPTPPAAPGSGGGTGAGTGGEMMVVMCDTSESFDTHFYFADRSILESVYSLMLVNVKESVHAVVAKYLEETYPESDREEDIAYHYINSNNINKKIKSLKYLGENSFNGADYIAAYQKYDLLFSVITGKGIDDLFSSCCRKFMRPSRLLVEPIRLDNNTTTNGNIIDVATRSFVSQKNVIVGQNQCHTYHYRWIHPSDVTRYISYLPGASREMSEVECTPGDTSHWMFLMILSLSRLGCYTESHNLTLLAFHEYGIKLPKEKKQEHLSRWGHPFRTIIKYCKRSIMKNYKNSVISTSAKLFQMFLEVMLNHCYLSILRGKAKVAVNIIEMSLRLIEKERERTDQSSVFFEDVPPVIQSSGKLSIAETTAANDNLPEERSQWGRTLSVFQLQFEALLSVVLRTSFTKPKVARRLAALLQKIDESCAVDEIAASDPLILLCRAINYSSVCNFETASSLLDDAIDNAQVYRDDTVQYLAVLLRGWMSFMSGENTLAAEYMEQVLIFASGTSHSALHTWALELMILIKTILKDFRGAESDWSLIKLVKRSSKLPVTTAAVIAFYLTAAGRMGEAEEYAITACSGLALKEQFTPIGGMLLFCATYAALDILEANMLSRNSVRSQTRRVSFIRRNRRRSSLLDQNSYRQELELGNSIAKAMDTLELLSVKFPCLIVLLLTLLSRVEILSGAQPQAAPLLLAEIDRRANSSICNNLSSFSFGQSYFQLHRERLVQYINR